ncbi:hypothetical protein TIFTF001_026852 [Ficus carica]|uniref:Uncharacterized protein n=1 Tax=Ficus carica TaxID=3494 RepID=A0AA88DLX7_FICCA|nr:hypothetical protein TIFTF001_026852 [Ficus carica]
MPRPATSSSGVIGSPLTAPIKAVSLADHYELVPSAAMTKARANEIDSRATVSLKSAISKPVPDQEPETTPPPCWIFSTILISMALVSRHRCRADRDHDLHHGDAAAATSLLRHQSFFRFLLSPQPTDFLHFGCRWILSTVTDLLMELSSLSYWQVKIDLLFEARMAAAAFFTSDLRLRQSCGGYHVKTHRYW